MIQEYNPNIQIEKQKMSSIRTSKKLNSSISMGSENIDPNLNNMSFAPKDDEDPPSPWTVKRKSILKKPETARKLDSSLNISKI